jgi:hypothetical protein
MSVIKLSSKYGVLAGMYGTYESLYSSETESHIKQLDKCISEEINRHECKSEATRPLVFIDGTCHIGGFAIPMAKLHPDITFHCIEINEDVFKILKLNLNKSGITNIKLYNGDYITYTEFPSDIVDRLNRVYIYLDPPWGGPKYKHNVKTKLYLSGKNINTVLIPFNYGGMLHETIYFIKVPINYDFDDLARFDYKKINIYKNPLSSSLMISKNPKGQSLEEVSKNRSDSALRVSKNPDASPSYAARFSGQSRRLGEESVHYYLIIIRINLSLFPDYA